MGKEFTMQNGNKHRMFASNEELEQRIAALETLVADLEFNQRKILEALHIAPKSPTTP